ncbi:MAG: 4'-phosphopantetheinyl transferase superfamily protein [Halioglobus sp.]|nr:4'-phosphopantetheinyl transferase superfamily protein [Halioglobus sp.]
MIGSSVKKSSVSEALAIPSAGELHLWLCHRDIAADTNELLRRVLSRYTGVDPGQLSMRRGPQGKPALAWPGPAEPGRAEPGLPLDFNISDSGDWLALVLSDGTAVGIDLEYCAARRDVLKLARRFFRVAELADLEACGGAERSSRFYDYWTLKEACIKATGGSLGHELEATGFTVRYPAVAAGRAAPGCIVPLAPTTTVPAWYCLAQPLADYRLAVCGLAPRDFSSGLRCFELRAGTVAIERPLALRAVSMVSELMPEACHL